MDRHVEWHGIDGFKILGLHVVFSGLEVNRCHMNCVTVLLE